MSLSSKENKNLYELIFIARQDVSSQDIDKISDNLNKIVHSYNGELIKKEYWGLRPLAYTIKKNNKGHYVFFGFRATTAGIKEMDRRIKLDENILRHSVIAVEKIDQEPSPILRSFEANSTPVINVTTEATN